MVLLEEEYTLSYSANLSDTLERKQLTTKITAFIDRQIPLRDGRENLIVNRVISSFIDSYYETGNNHIDIVDVGGKEYYMTVIIHENTINFIIHY